MPCKILLDENILFGEDEKKAQMVADLGRQGIDALFVGQDHPHPMFLGIEDPDFDRFHDFSEFGASEQDREDHIRWMTEQRMLRRDKKHPRRTKPLEKFSFRPPPDNLVELYRDRFAKCIAPLERPMREQEALTPAQKQQFKNCMGEEFSKEMPFGTWTRWDNKLKKAVPDTEIKLAFAPPKGTDDRDIRRFAIRDNRLILSCDRGRDLESRANSDRIALDCSQPITTRTILHRLNQFCDCCVTPPS